MSVNEKIRVMREINQWSQEEMAEKMGLSTTGYAKIERGQTKLNIDKLLQIANIFQCNASELLPNEPISPKWYNNTFHGSNSANYYASDSGLILEIERLKSRLEAKEEQIRQLQELLSLFNPRKSGKE